MGKTAFEEWWFYARNKGIVPMWDSNKSSAERAWNAAIEAALAAGEREMMNWTYPDSAEFCLNKIRELK